MRILVVGLVFAAACGKGKGDAPAASGSADVKVKATEPAAPAVVPPGLGGKVEPPPAAEGYRTLPPQRFRHSSVRGDFRIYKTTAGIVVSWKTLLSARSLDGKPMWKKEDQGRAVAVSPDGTRIVTNNDAGELLILDVKTGAPIGAPTQLGGRGDSARENVWISAFAWLPDGKKLLALDSKHVYLLDDKGAVVRELPIKCKEDDCFFTSAVALSNDEAIVVSGSGTSSGQVLKIKLADGSTLASADHYGHDVDLSSDHTQLLVDGSSELAMFDPATLQPRWTVPMPGFRGLKLTGASEYSSIEFKSMPKLSPDAKHVVVNDNAGRLWLLDAKDGKPVMAYATELTDFVEDVIWLDGATLIVIDNPGHVLRIAGTPPKVVWSEIDGPENGKWDEP